MVLADECQSCGEDLLAARLYVACYCTNGESGMRGEALVKLADLYMNSDWPKTGGRECDVMKAVNLLNEALTLGCVEEAKEVLEGMREQIFEDFRKVYLGTKRGCKVEFENFKKKHRDWKEVLPNLKPAYERQIAAKKAQRGSIDPRYEKHLQTYINQRCWEEEINYGSNTSTANHGHEAPSATDKARQRAIETLRANGYM
jgi:hypothetical protein